MLEHAKLIPVSLGTFAVPFIWNALSTNPSMAGIYFFSTTVLKVISPEQPSDHLVLLLAFNPHIMLVLFMILMNT